MVYLAIALVVYYTLHSVLAADFVKSLVQRNIPPHTYRLIYVLLAVVLLFIPLKYYLLAPDNLIAESGLFGRLIFFTITIFSLRISALSFKKVSLTQFLGLRSYSSTRLVVTGVFQFVRHPLYLSVMLILTGWCIAVPSQRNLLLLTITLAYIFFGYTWEEQKLIKEFGEDYKKYKNQVPALLPVDWKGFLKYVFAA